MVDGIGLKTYALCDTGADISLSMTPKMAKKLVDKLGAKLEPL